VVEEQPRSYIMSQAELLRRHVRVNAGRALLTAISISAVVAGFMDATNHTWGLLRYLGLTAILTILALAALGLRGPRVTYLLLVPGARRPRVATGRPRELELLPRVRRAPLRRVDAARNDDPVYTAGLRVLLGPSRPLLVIPSNRRDVRLHDELLLPIFVDRQRRSHVKVDLRPYGIPLEPYVFDRELPEGIQDVDHTLAVKDLVFVPELAAALTAGSPHVDVPIMLPEHCVDPGLLAERDVVVVGGPDTNFWHGALFEAAWREFREPASSVPLALDMREEGAFPTYGSRSLTVRLGQSSAVFPYGEPQQVVLDERLYPTYAMILACRNPLAAAVGRSHWVVFVGGTRSLGTCGAMLGLTLMLREMRADPDRNFWIEAPTKSPKVHAPVSAALVRVSEVEQAALRRDGGLSARQRRRQAAEGLDPHYSDTYVPTEVEYLSFAGGDRPHWATLGRIGT
jgi:hypothetical protein